MARTPRRWLTNKQKLILIGIIGTPTVFSVVARLLRVPTWVDGIIAAISVLILVSWFGSFLKWTGFRDKTLWDWMQLLVIPLTLAAATLLISYFQFESEQRRAEQRVQVDRDLAQDNLREAALQDYFDDMSELLLDKNLRLSQPGAEIRNVARTKTLSTLLQLDGRRKGFLLQFLFEAQLIRRGVLPETQFSNPIIGLAGADLRGADATGINLELVALDQADLSGANLSNTSLRGATLSGTKLRGTVLVNARFDAATLVGADLTEANLTGATLKFLEIREIVFERVNLSSANLTNATLTGASSPEANLENATLNGADLTGADLSLAQVTAEQLATCKSLKDTIMPDGSQHD